jgi:hypothetical protein
MVAMQKLNAFTDQVIFGLVSNGKSWEFGQLQGVTFTKNLKTYVLSDLTSLFAALNYVFAQCQLLVENEPCLTR